MKRKLYFFRWVVMIPLFVILISAWGPTYGEYDRTAAILPMDSSTENLRFRYGIKDSLVNALKDHKMIGFSWGHNSINWVLIIDCDTNYRIMRGNSRNIIDSIYYAPFDTTRLINNNKRLIRWAIDTMPELAKHMTIVKEEMDYNPFIAGNQWHIMHNGQNDLMFRNFFGKYAGPDSISFNSKTDALSKLSLWFQWFTVRDLIHFPEGDKKND